VVLAALEPEPEPEPELLDAGAGVVEPESLLEEPQPASTPATTTAASAT
jgi:hypothetical protein